MARATAKAQMQIRRAEKSWTYIYVFLGFLLTIEGNILALAQLDRVWGLSLYFVIGALTVYLFLENAWFQNKLTGWRNSYENKWR